MGYTIISFISQISIGKKRWKNANVNQIRERNKETYVTGHCAVVHYSFCFYLAIPIMQRKGVDRKCMKSNREKKQGRKIKVKYKFKFKAKVKG